MAKQGEQKTGTRPKRKQLRQVASGIACVKATYNNTIVTITDLSGHAICWASGGSTGHKGSRKSSAFAGSIAALRAGKEAASRGVKEVDVRLHGPGAGRESAVRALKQAGLEVRSISDCTPVPHNGCRPKKMRRP